MITVSYEFPDRASAKAALDALLKKAGVTGELEIRPTDTGKWLMKVHSEKDIKDTSVEKLGGHRLD